MISLTDFFVLNRDIILFVYGLAFFLLGFAIILQTRKSSRLELARSLRWLAVFGITHGFYEWGDLFIPIQAEYLSETTVQVLYFFHKLLLAFSFLCLFEFGVAVLPFSKHVKWFHWETVAVFLLWFVVAFLVFPGDPVDSIWRRTANAFARYIIGFPGGILSAYGLRAHTIQKIAPLNVPKIVRMFGAAGVSLGIYAILASISPPVNFPPGNIINTETFTQFVGAPPMVFRSLVALAITFTLIRALEVFDLETERRIEQLEQQQIINAEQERLARDLHDGAIQKVYTAGLLVESATRLAEPESEMDIRLKRAVVALSDSIADLRRNLSELHAHTQTPSANSLPEIFRNIAGNPNYNTLIHISVHTDLPDEKNISNWRAAHVYAIVNEAMANTIRHAQASEVSIHASDKGDAVVITIKDNGTGLPTEARNGYGLRNMRDRARLLSSTINFENNKGLAVILEVPWKD